MPTAGDAIAGGNAYSMSFSNATWALLTDFIQDTASGLCKLAAMGVMSQEVLYKCGMHG